MCNDAQTHAFLAALPKCEHHLHLEGTMEPDLLFKLASKNNIALPSPELDEAFTSQSTLLARYRKFTSLEDFLRYYFIGMSVLVTASDFEELAWEYFLKAERDGVVHAEVFFDPQAHSERGVKYETVLQGFEAACRRAEAELGISSELIVCILRHMPVSSAQELYETALPDLKSGRVKGMGLSSTEKGFPPSLFQSIYENAEKEGINRTAHAGEEAGVSYMREALELCRVQRADHGIKLVDDPELMKRYADEGIMVTMCPLSNVELRCVKNVRELPVREYLDHRVRFSVNSDDPAYFGGYVLANHCAVEGAFGLSKEEWGRIVGNGIEGSWCSEERKGDMHQILEEVLRKYGGS